MPGWVVSALLAAAVMVAILIFGSLDAAKILLTMALWFAVLSAVALGIETVVQFIGGRLGRR